MKKLIACLLALATLVPLATGCTVGEPADTSATTTTTVTTTATTTAKPKPGYPSDDMDSQFAEPTYLLAKQILKDYWRSSHLNSDIKSGTAVVWGFASFMEAIAEAYLLFPMIRPLLRHMRKP